MDRSGELLAEFGPGQVLTGAAELAPHLASWFGDETGAALALLRPRDTRETRAMLRAAARLGLGVVPQGGNTGLVGGAIARDAEAHVILSLGRLDRIRSLDPDDYSVVAEAGCILQTVKEAAATRDLFLPVSIGAQGSCQIGGIVSTNAGGINVLRYGMTRDQVLGLEVVLADGSLWDGLSTLRKNNTGPDLTQLFIGAEGTFGVITAAALRLVPQPTATAAALVGLPGVEAAMSAFHRARRHCSDLLSAFELMMPPAMEMARTVLPAAPALATPSAAYALIELAAPGPIALGPVLEGFLEAALEAGHVTDALLAASEAQARVIFSLREGINEALARSAAPFLRSDVSVRLSALPAFVTGASAAIEAGAPGTRAVAYGHFGDGNIHLNVLPPEGAAPAAAAASLETAKKILNDWVDRFEGSISAEHGIGRMKRADFDARIRPAQRRMLRALKATLDPEGRMNPGALHV